MFQTQVCFFIFLNKPLYDSYTFFYNTSHDYILRNKVQGSRDDVTVN